MTVVCFKKTVNKCEFNCKCCVQSCRNHIPTVSTSNGYVGYIESIYIAFSVGQTCFLTNQVTETCNGQYGILWQVINLPVSVILQFVIYQGLLMMIIVLVVLAHQTQKNSQVRLLSNKLNIIACVRFFRLCYRRCSSTWQGFGKISVILSSTVI